MAQKKVSAEKRTLKKKPAPRKTKSPARKHAALTPVELAAERRRMVEIVKILKREYPEARCSLTYCNAFELLIATILSAQCTDERVNKTTPALFKRLSTPQAMSQAPLAEIEKLIQSTGFYKNKAKALKECSRAIVELYGGEVPAEQEKLTGLRGVGRKTANVVLGNVFEIPGIVVDTHVGRLARRMGFTRHLDPVKVEYELMEIVVREDWTQSNHLMIEHGRQVCTARRAFCERCALSRFCPKIGV